MTDPDRDRFRGQIGQLLGVPPERIALFARGRVALYALLRAVGIRPGDEVILPAYTCVAVPNAIIYAGATPVWVDIDPATLCIDPDAAAAAVTPRTRVIVAQNTFGLSADIERLQAVADDHGATVIDDCTHGLGGTYGGAPSGTTASLAFFSTQWSKPVSTGLGGFAVDRDGALGGRLRGLEDEAHDPSAARVAALRALVFARELAGTGRLLRAGRAAYRTVSRTGVLPGSSTGEELTGVAMPRDFLAKLSSSQARLGADRIERLPSDVDRRRRTAHRYSDFLRERGLTAACEPATQRHAFLRYPLRVADRERVIAAATDAGVDLGDWFVSPVHPVTTGLSRWAYTPGTAPNAERACREVVNLPTDPSLADKDVGRVLAFLTAQRDLIL